MRKSILFSLFLISGLSIAAQQTFTVTASGFSFNPSNITAHVGDQVVFNVGSSHPVLQVDETTYNSNGNTALQDGFSFPTGLGTVNLTEPGTLFYICIPHISFGMKGKIEIMEATGISPNISAVEFNVYPNPVNDYLYFNHQGNSTLSEIEIFDVSGKTVLKASAEDLKSNALQVDGLRKGLYFITVEYIDKSYTRKFIKL
jgi:plastocyanin